SPDGTWAATAGAEHIDGGNYHYEPTAQLWNTETGQPVTPVMRNPSGACCATFSPDGRRLAVGCDDGEVQLWDTATGRPLGAPMRLRGGAPSWENAIRAV